MSDRKPLGQIWIELNPKPKGPTFEEQKERIYRSVEACMQARKTKCEIELYYLVKTDVPDLMKWIREYHGLKCILQTVDRGCNPSTHDTMWTPCLVVTWG